MPKGAKERGDERELHDKVALVVGGTQNMGFAIAEELASLGATMVVSYAHDEQAASNAVKRLEALGVPAKAVYANATETDDTDRLFEHVIEKHGRVDLVVHMPGAVLKKPLVEVTDDEYDHVMNLNARSAFLTLRQAGKRVSDNGRIVVLSTTLTGVTTGFYGVYAAGKAAAEQMVKALAQEIGSRGVTVNLVAPGPVDTRFFHNAETAESVRYVTHAVPQQRLGQPNDIAPVVGFLMSDRASWITGQVIRVNGGMF
jgi:3-oxoacyl-[acyl-carrier protein] reductase